MRKLSPQNKKSQELKEQTTKHYKIDFLKHSKYSLYVVLLLLEFKDDFYVTFL
jgi:hypothetical protein